MNPDEIIEALALERHLHEPYCASRQWGDCHGAMTTVDDVRGNVRNAGHRTNGEAVRACVNAHDRYQTLRMALNYRAEECNYVLHTSYLAFLLDGVRRRLREQDRAEFAYTNSRKSEDAIAWARQYLATRSVEAVTA